MSALPFLIENRNDQVIVTAKEKVTTVEQIQQLMLDLSSVQLPITFKLAGAFSNNYMLIQMMALLANERKTIRVEWSDREPTVSISKFIHFLTQPK
jgi:hypothetical protein